MELFLFREDTKTFIIEEPFETKIVFQLYKQENGTIEKHEKNIDSEVNESDKRASRCNNSCRKLLKTKEDFENHIKVHHGTKYRFQCEMCCKKFVTRRSLGRHKNANKCTINTKCATCDFDFGNNWQYRRHLIQTHNTSLYLCEICGQGFSSNATRKEHMITHNPDLVNKKDYKCDKCDKSFNSVRKLNLHKLNHNEKKSCTCEVCGKTCKSRDCWRAHQKTHNEKNIQCKVCEKMFNRKEALRSHMLTHTGEKPFKCEICGKCFTQKSPLNRHLKLHSEERPFPCELCDSKFIRQCELTIHMKARHSE